VLLFENSDIRRRSFGRTLPDQVTANSMGDFLRALKAANRIQSADHSLDEAAAHGRNIEPRRIGGDDAAARERLGGPLTGAHEARAGAVPPAVFRICRVSHLKNYGSRHTDRSVLSRRAL
jgi:hypothetical protein